MQKFYLENMNLKVTISQHGAELIDILNKENGAHYLWNGDPEYWKRTAPVLFPIVGSLQNKKLVVDGKEYELNQHGFARDTDFDMKKQKNGKEITFVLESNAATEELYPYRFRLEIIYTLDRYTVKTTWRVTNLDDKEMHFHIGGHPAFMCPPRGKERKTDEFISFDTVGDLKYSLLDANGLVTSRDNVLKTDDKCVAVTEEMFDNDAIIFENQDIHSVALCDSKKIPFVTVAFDAPLVGIWSPAKKNAPFICIEPWYGRADAADFHGDIAEREYDNALPVGETFEASYTITVAN